MTEDFEDRLTAKSKARLEARTEEALRAALKPMQPPLGFAQRLEARLAAESPSASQTALGARKSGWRVYVSGARPRLAAAAALLFAIVIPVGLRVHHQQEQARGEAARQQVLLALRITGTQLHSIQERTSITHTGSLEGDTQ